jgi:hypothetical protein
MENVARTGTIKYIIDSNSNVPDVASKSSTHLVRLNPINIVRYWQNATHKKGIRGCLFLTLEAGN